MTTFITRASGLIQLLRIKQWIKNGFVFAPLIFSGEFTYLASIKQTLIAFFLFCIASSSVYALNDLLDRERDRRHPIKRKSRPIASGTVKVHEAIALIALIYLVLAGFWFLFPAIIQIIFAYIALNIAYSFWLKHQPVLDIFCIAIGFVMRVYAGAVAISVPLSSWMFITTLCLALYLAATKRKQELKISGKEGREILGQYTIELVDRYALITAVLSIVFYSLYVLSTQNELAITIPFVLFGLFRYWFIVETLNGGESPTDTLLKDIPLLLTVAFWAGLCAWTLWHTGATA